MASSLWYTDAETGAAEWGLFEQVPTASDGTRLLRFEDVFKKSPVAELTLDEYKQAVYLYLAKSKDGKNSVYGEDCKEILSTTEYPEFGYYVQTERISSRNFGGGADIVLKVAYTIGKNEFIGNPGVANFLCRKRGIAPTKRTEKSTICSIGYCKKDEKWYGWSHRAICGFGIGDRIFEKDYGTDQTLFTNHGNKVIKNMEDAKQAAMNFAEFVN